MAILAIALNESAQAYVDPNSAGPLYQFLFPALVAATSIIAGFKRAIVRFWHRLTGSRAGEVRSEPADADGESNA